MKACQFSEIRDGEREGEVKGASVNVFEGPENGSSEFVVQGEEYGQELAFPSYGCL